MSGGGEAKMLISEGLVLLNGTVETQKRKKLADMVARGELSLVKLRERIDDAPRARRSSKTPAAQAGSIGTIEDEIGAEGNANWIGTGAGRPVTDDSLIAVRAQLADAITDLIAVIQSDAMKTIDATDRQNLAKYLTIARVRLENAITLVRRGGADH